MVGEREKRESGGTKKTGDREPFCHCHSPMVGSILLELDQDELPKPAAVVVGYSAGITKSLELNSS